MSKDIKKALEHCIEWNCADCPNREELGSGETVCRGRLLPYVLEYVSDLETKLADLQQEQVKEMQEHQEAMELADKTINNLVEDNRASQEWYKKQLAESEKKHLLDEKEWQDYCAFKHIEPQIKGCLDREREYEKQLAESEETIKYLKGIKRYDIGETLTENIQLKQQLAKKEEQVQKSQEMYFETLKELDELEDNFNNISLELWAEKIMNQDKISFAVEQLEKVKGYFGELSLYEMYDKIDNQIKQLKERKNESYI